MCPCLSHQEALGAECVSDCVGRFVEMLLPVLLGLLKGVDPAQEDVHLRKQCHRITHVTSLLLDILYLTALAAAPVLHDPVCFEAITFSTPVCQGLHQDFSVTPGER